MRFVHFPLRRPDLAKGQLGPGQSLGLVPHQRSHALGIVKLLHLSGSNPSVYVNSTALRIGRRPSHRQRFLQFAKPKKNNLLRRYYPTVHVSVRNYGHCGILVDHRSATDS